MIRWWRGLEDFCYAYKWSLADVLLNTILLYSVLEQIVETAQSGWYRKYSDPGSILAA